MRNPAPSPSKSRRTGPFTGSHPGGPRGGGGRSLGRWCCFGQGPLPTQGAKGPGARQSPVLCREPGGCPLWGRGYDKAGRGGAESVGAMSLLPFPGLGLLGPGPVACGELGSRSASAGQCGQQGLVPLPGPWPTLQPLDLHEGATPERWTQWWQFITRFPVALTTFILITLMRQERNGNGAGLSPGLREGPGARRHSCLALAVTLALLSPQSLCPAHGA